MYMTHSQDVHVSSNGFVRLSYQQNHPLKIWKKSSRIPNSARTFKGYVDDFEVV